ncbi:MAG: hypothetical protein KatS3mg060_2495 [Dehalococcoidia bacterium]|nr:MAG: hypothetical protein KatS3mg060_2495 [Dehalococcoidia bacterium]
MNDTPAPFGELSTIGSDQFAASFGEPLERALDPCTWLPGEYLNQIYCRIEAEVEAADRLNDDLRAAIRQQFFGRIDDFRRASPDLGDEIGWYAATPDVIRRQHVGLLFPGRVEAVDGTCVDHETLPLTVLSIGVVLVAYDGDHGSWGHRLFRRDLRLQGTLSLPEIIAIMKARTRRNDHTASSHDRLSELGRDGIMAYMERAVLLDFAKAPWRLGHGNPVAFPMLTGAGSMEFLHHSLALLRKLIDYQRFVYVQSRLTDRELLTIGQALQPLEYFVYDTAEEAMRRVVESETYTRHYRKEASDFVREYGPKIVRGVYRASASAPPHVFYAHRERIHEAALIALADSTMQEHRGFPLLIDLADSVARTTFDPTSTKNLVRTAYAARGKPYRYLNERDIR